MPGPRTGLRDAVPSVNMRRRGERARVEPVIRRALVGRQLGIADEIRPLGAEAGERVEFVACVTATGMPDCSVQHVARSSRWQRAERCHRAACAPSPTADPRRRTPRRRAGCRRSNSRDRATRLKLSATGKFATGPVRIDASNTDEASSISFERV